MQDIKPMNYYTRLSIELANQRDYLDQLFKVYPFAPESIRSLDSEIWAEIEKGYKENDNDVLLRALLKLESFPITDYYVPFFKIDESAISRNPRSVRRICSSIRELDLGVLLEKCTQPKETNRQMGPLFRNWLNSGALGLIPVKSEQFLNTDEDAILAGSDKELMVFAQQHLGYQRDKGLDFLGRFNGTYVIGEAKFISDEGGHQNDQFEDALLTINSPVKKNVKKIGILDGVLYIPSQKKMYKKITENDIPIMSSLILNTYLHAL